MTTATKIKTFDVDEVFPETPVNNSVLVVGTGFRGFLIRAVVAALLIGGAILGALLLSHAINPPASAAATTTTITGTGAATTVTGPSAGIESTVNYKWTQILGPNGTKLYTQCSSSEPGLRIFMSQGGAVDFRSDKSCK